MLPDGASGLQGTLQLGGRGRGGIIPTKEARRPYVTPALVSKLCKEN